MPKPVTHQQNNELSQLEQHAIIELWEIDLRKIKNFNGQYGNLYRLCSHVNPLGKDVVWNGETYSAYPLQGEGFALSGQGPSNRPKLTVSNLFGLVTGIVNDFDDVVGAVVCRRQVYVQYLDAVNFEGGNPQADPTQELPPSYYIIERLSDLNSQFATFELALPAETDGALLPARMMTVICMWEYRGEECGYRGPAVADEKDRPTTDLSKDKCSHCLTGCRLRFGANSILPYGGYPSMDKVG